MGTNPTPQPSGSSYKKIINFFQSIWNYFVLLGKSIFSNGGAKRKIEDGNGIQPWSEIPHAKGLPILGTLVDLIRAGGGSQLHNYIANRHDQLGPIFRESLGGRDVLFLSTPELFVEVRKQEGPLPLEIMTNSSKYYHELHKDAPIGLFSSTTEELWAAPRQKLNDVLLKKSSTLLDAFIGYQDLVQQYMVKWKDSSEANINNYQYLENSEKEIIRHSLHAMASVTLGTRYEDHFKNSSIDLENITTNVTEMFTHTNTLAALNPKIAKTCGMSVWKNFEKSYSQATKHAYALLKEGFRCLNDESIHHSLSEDGILLQVLEKYQSEEESARVLFGNFSESILTLAGAITWAIYSVARDPEVQENILKEVKSVCGDNSSVAVHDLEHMNYLSNTIKESLRMYPVATFVGRLFNHDYVIGGYHVPAGKNCCLSTMYTQRNPEYFVDPEKFWPDRWKKEVGSLNPIGVKNQNAFIAFGIGKRSCVGKKLALIVLKLLVASLVQNFEMECDEVKPVMRTILAPDQPLNLKLVPRK